MKDFEIIRSAEQLRSLAREQRLEILRHAAEEPMTATIVARRIGRPVNQIHYHVQQLLEQGLLEEVTDARRERKDERYYRAAARQFLVDPGMTGSDDPISLSFRQSVEVSALHARRRLLELDLSRIAQRLVSDALQVRKNDRVLVVFAPTALELVEALVVELEALGAEARTRIWSRNVILQTLDRHDPESLADHPFIHPGLSDGLDAVIFVMSSIPQGAPPSPEQRKKLPLLLDAVTQWQKSLVERGVRSLEIALPHRGEFEGGWMTPEEAIDTYWRSLDSDPGMLRQLGSALLEELRANTKWTLTDTRGSSLALDIEPESIHVGDGVVSQEDIEERKTADTLPAGVIASIPKIGCGTGTLWADYTYLAGRHYYDVRLDIEDGRIASLDARENGEELLASIRRESGDPDLLSCVSIGINPGGDGLTGRPSLDAIFSGVVNFTFGNNEVDGGSVRSTLTLNLPSSVMTLRAGDRIIVAEGVLQSSQAAAPEA
ncbi:MAG: helix-turn-helix domain-containing protein [Candidatus Eisenbacteria bacterium]